MQKVFKEAIAIVRTRANAEMSFKEIDNAVQYTFYFEHFIEHVIVTEEDSTLTASLLARHILDELQEKVVDRYLQNNNFCDGFGNYVHGRFQTKKS